MRSISWWPNFDPCPCLCWYSMVFQLASAAISFALRVCSQQVSQEAHRLTAKVLPRVPQHLKAHAVAVASGHFVSTAARAIIDGTPAPTRCDNCHAQTVPVFKHEVWDCTALQDRHTAVPTTTLQAALAWPAPQLSTQQNTDVLIWAAGIRARLLEQRYNGGGGTPRPGGSARGPIRVWSSLSGAPRRQQSRSTDTAKKHSSSSSFAWNIFDLHADMVPTARHTRVRRKGQVTNGSRG